MQGPLVPVSQNRIHEAAPAAPCNYTSSYLWTHSSRTQLSGESQNTWSPGAGFSHGAAAAKVPQAWGRHQSTTPFCIPRGDVSHPFLH